MDYNKEEEEAFRDRIATVNEEGKRVWIFAKKPKGPYFNKRKIVSYFLLALLFLAPHIKIGGHQMLLFNLIERKFILLLSMVVFSVVGYVRKPFSWKCSFGELNISLKEIGLTKKN
jgi:hypothetical protein